MTRPKASPPKPWPAIPVERKDEHPERVPGGVAKDQWIDDFIRRFKQTLEDIGRKR
jgi:hypothetical protein